MCVCVCVVESVAKESEPQYFPHQSCCFPWSVPAVETEAVQAELMNRAEEAWRPGGGEGAIMVGALGGVFTEWVGVEYTVALLTWKDNIC